MSDEQKTDKVIKCKMCTNKSNEGRFVGELCVPCFEKYVLGGTRKIEEEKSEKST